MIYSTHQHSLLFDRIKGSKNSQCHHSHKSMCGFAYCCMIMNSKAMHEYIICYFLLDNKSINICTTISN